MEALKLSDSDWSLIALALDEKAATDRWLVSCWNNGRGGLADQFKQQAENAERLAQFIRTNAGV